MRTISIEEQLKICDYSTLLAIGSFAAGTVLFATHFVLSEDTNLDLFGLFYIVIASLVNGIMLLYLGYIFIRFPTAREDMTIKILLLLSHIPVAILYAYIVISDVTHQMSLSNF
jgi:hypothetical protein